MVDTTSEKPAEVEDGFWLRLWKTTDAIFRALGLGLLSSIRPRRWSRRQAREPLKIVIRQSRPVALLRSIIHLIPVGLVLWLVGLNWATYYVGSYTYDQIYYQIGAKVLEILIQASLAAITLAFLRHELVHGKGIPFGALFFGLQVSQLSYLWSMELWGSMGSKWLSFQKKVLLWSLTLLVIALAAAAGPSSAILLIPRRDYWPGGSTHIWINGTKEDIWPMQ